jgi:hypothetical protein
MFVAVAVIGLVPLTGPALAAPPAVVVDLNPDTGLPPGQSASLSFSISPDARTLSSFTLTPPSGYVVESVDSVTSGTATIVGGAIRVTGLSTAPAQTTTVTFSATTSCLNGTHAWGVDARDSQNRAYNVSGDRSSDVSGNCDLNIVSQPNNTKAGDLITSGDRQVGGFVTVQLVNDAGQAVTHFPMSVTFVLGSNPAGGTLSVTPETTNGSGLATFDSKLQIDTANVAAFSDYTLVPRGATLPAITGAASNGFDIWQSGAKCSGNGQCSLGHNGDEYLVPNGQAGALLSASTFSTNESNIDCGGYTEITGDVVWHEYTGDGPVLVKIHITRQEMKASANNGQKLVGLCVGLVDDVGGLTGQQKWASIGVTAQHQDSTGDGTPDIWVALAPNCPNQLPQQNAPCIARQYGDGNGGSFTEAWLTGGDPPRRT